MKKIFLSVIMLFLFMVPVSAQEYLVKSGDTLQGIFSEQLTPLEIDKLFHDIRKRYPTYVLKIGEIIVLNDEYAIVSPQRNTDIVIEFVEEGYSLEEIEAVVVTMPTLVSGTITTNLFDSIQAIGENIELAAMMASIYEWEIDFFRDLRVGDKYSILVEKKFVNDEYAGYGKILAADFNVNGTSKKTAFYDNTDYEGYYTPEGKALARGFLKVPLKFTRISSRFSYSRLHPVNKTYKPHYGVDYAAPRGTPVFTTANGTITKMRHGKYNGNYVIVQHANGYKTYYLHLHGFNRGLREGYRVTKGQTIGYVGNTGISTGPHLDYRVKHYNTWINPLKMKIQPEKSIRKELMADFNLQAGDRLAAVQNAGLYYAATDRNIRMLAYN